MQGIEGFYTTKLRKGGASHQTRVYLSYPGDTRVYGTKDPYATKQKKGGFLQKKVLLHRWVVTGVVEEGQHVCLCVCVVCMHT